MRKLYYILSNFIIFVNCSPNFNFNYVRNVNNNYDNAIASADIFYINPNPRFTTVSVKINELNDVQNKSELKLLIHGYYANRNHVAMAPVRYAYLAKGLNALYVADWDQAAKLFYPASRNLIKRVGIKLAKILEKFLSRHNISFENVHIIGHSLGAHMAGVVGRYFKGKIGRITGLDPALPLFKPNSSDSLKATDAVFVDVIHTDDGILGDSTPRGHVDFYANYGLAAQPGCSYLDVLTFTSCSHYRAPLLYAESIQLPNNFPSVKCDYSKIRARNVASCWSVDANDVTLLGENISRNARGTYFLETNNVPPYGLGIYSKRLLNGNTQ